MTPTPLDSHVCAGALPLRLWEQACPTHRLVERFRSSNHIARTVGWAKARSSRRAHLERPKVGTLRFARPTDRFHGIALLVFRRPGEPVGAPWTVPLLRPSGTVQ